MYGQAAVAHSVRVSEAPVNLRMEFIRKVYSLFMMGMMVAVLGAWWGTSTEGIKVITGIGIGPLILVYIGTFFATRFFRKVEPLNILLMLLFCLASGTLLAPLLFAVLANFPEGPTMILNAFMTTAAVFGGLTVYVFTSGKDFSYLGGTLVILLTGVVMASIFGLFVHPVAQFMNSMAYSMGMVVLMGAFVLYDTSRIMYRFNTDEHVMAAIELYLDFVIMFRHILMIFVSRRD